MTQYEKIDVNRGNVYKWIDRFKSNELSVDDKTRSVRTVEVSGVWLGLRIDGLIFDDRKITNQMIAVEVQISVVTV